jgi:enoyl-CoA hydratase/carnithine racemase
MTGPVELLIEEGVALVTLDEPDRRNGLTPEMVTALVNAFEAIQRDSSVRCVILTGRGSAFSAGGDPKRMLAPGLYPDWSTAQIRDFYKTGIQRLPLAVRTLDVPVIAAINGPAIGAGLDLACACDIRIASESASFAASFVKFGLVPGDGGAWLLPRAVGMANAAQMLLTGETIDATVAQRMGLVSQVVASADLDATARKIARDIAGKAPHAVRMTKRLLVDSQQLTFTAALEQSALMQAACHKMEDHGEAVRAFLERRPPNFSGR